jgi:hypothetical protein
MKKVKGLFICSLVLAAATANLFAQEVETEAVAVETEAEVVVEETADEYAGFGISISAQMDYTFAEGDDMGEFGLSDGDIVFNYEEEKFYAEVELEFKSTTYDADTTVTYDTNTLGSSEEETYASSVESDTDVDYSDILEEMYFAYDFADAFGLKGGKFQTAFADDWWGGSEMWGIELYGDVSIFGYQFDVVNGTNNKLVLQPVVTLSPVDILTLSFDGYIDLDEDTNNALCASAEVSAGPVWFYADVLYTIDSGDICSGIEFDYSINDDLAVYVWYDYVGNDDSLTGDDIYDDDDDATIAIDYTALPVNIQPSFTYYLEDSSSWEFTLNFEYDYSL